MPAQATHVLLVHGMGRTPVSMVRLARALRRAGLATRQFAYATAWQSVDAIVGRLERRLTTLSGCDYVVVGHSLGGLLLRAAIAGLAPGALRPRHFIMLGTPNRSPRLARRFQRAWWYRLLNGDAGELLASELRLARIPTPTVPCTVIAGTRGINGRWSPFGDEPNDGLVAVSETRLDGAEEWISVPARHPFIMNDPGVRQLIVDKARGET
jgi:pimeloyl-ACP methyl ester carboxylesterase